jgi:hypothetical protein
MNGRSWLRMLFTAVALAAMAGPTTAATADSVSPGAVDRVAVVDQRCPTFSWVAPGASWSELVAYALPEYLDDTALIGARLEDAEEALYTTVPGGASTWTPSTEQCLSPGRRYVWFVRALFETDDEATVETGEWSPGRYLAVPATPTPEEMRRALDVIRRWEDGSPTPAIERGRPVERPDAGADHPKATLGAKSVRTASAAIRGDNPDMSAETYGVIGTSESPIGGGVGAANLNGGPDLVLDGSVDGEPDARLWEWGLDRASATDWSFSFGNSGAGAMTLEVDGTMKANELDCPSCVTSATIADGTVASADVAFNYAGSSSKGGPASNLACTACVASTELSPTGGATGQVLKHTGSSVGWADDLSGTLTLPWSGGATSSGTNFYVANSGTGWAIHAEAAYNNAIVGDAWNNGAGVLGRQMLPTAASPGVLGTTQANGGVGVLGRGDAAAPNATGVKGQSIGGTGVLGVTERSVAVRGEVTFGIGVRGVSNGPDQTGGYPGAGVYGTVTGPGYGVYGSTGTTGQFGVYGESGANWGALGQSDVGAEGYGSLGNTGVYGDSNSGHGVEGHSGGSGTSGAAILANNGNPGGIALYATSSSIEATIVGRNNGTGDLMRMQAGANIRFRVQNGGDVSADGAFLPGGADFAELLPAFSNDLEPGDVLAISADGRLMRSQQAYQASVVGVYSTKPGVLGGSTMEGPADGVVPLAVVGVVPVKACAESGPVRPGDMLVASSIPGHAMRAGERPAVGRVIGKALTGLEDGEGVITMLVILQ